MWNLATLGVVGDLGTAVQTGRTARHTAPPRLTLYERPLQLLLSRHGAISDAIDVG
jgi:hypothetical protein